MSAVPSRGVPIASTSVASESRRSARCGGVVGRVVLAERVAVGNAAVLGAPPARTPAAVRDPAGDRDVERGAIDTRLAARDDARAPRPSLLGAAVRARPAPPRRRSRAPDGERQHVRQHQEEMIRHRDAGRLEMKLRRARGAEEERARQHAERPPASEDDDRERDEAAAADMPSTNVLE